MAYQCLGAERWYSHYTASAKVYVLNSIAYWACKLCGVKVHGVRDRVKHNRGRKRLVINDRRCYGSGDKRMSIDLRKGGVIYTKYMHAKIHMTSGQNT